MGQQKQGKKPFNKRFAATHVEDYEDAHVLEEEDEAHDVDG